MIRRENHASDGAVALPVAPQPLSPPIVGGRGALADRWGPAVERLEGVVPSRLRALGEVQLSARLGQLALVAIALGALAVVAFASAGSSTLVPRSAAAFPGWEAGPLHLLLAHPGLPQTAVNFGYSGLLIVMTGAYAAALMARRALSLRAIWAFAIVSALILLLSPPLQLNDVWNYIGYARLGAIHHLNPYAHVMFAESNDPIYTFSTWRNLSSPYGPLFTALSYPLAVLPIPVAYWLLKAVIVAVSLAFLWTVGRCARSLGQDPRLALLLLAANPVYLFYEVGGFHNDFLMLLPSMAAVALVVGRRDRAAGAVLMLAVAIKLTAIVLLPFLLVAAGLAERRRRMLVGCVLAALPLLAMSLAMFGFSMPNLADQSSVVTPFSIPNLVGRLIGTGGSTSTLVHIADLGVVLVVLWGVRKRDWATAAGWATVALIASVPWLMPWYVVWALPLAAIALSRRLRWTVVALTVFLVLTFAPETGPLLAQVGIHPMGSATDRAALALQARLQDH